MWEQASRLEDGDYEQSAMVQLFLDCVDRTNEQHAAFVSCRERPMHEDDQQSQAPRVVDLILDECVSGRLLMTGATGVAIVSCGDVMLKIKFVTKVGRLCGCTGRRPRSTERDREQQAEN